MSYNIDDINATCGPLAHTVGRRFHVDPADLYQHGRIFAWQHRERIDRFYEDDSARASRRVSRMLSKAMEQLARKERAYRLGFDPSDEAQYSTAMIEEMLPVLFDPSLGDSAPVTDRLEVSGPSDPSIQPLWQVHVIDMQRAWQAADLTMRERGVLGRRYGDYASLAEIAHEYEVSEADIEKSVKRSLRRLVDALGGESPRTCGRECRECAS